MIPSSSSIPPPYVSTHDKRDQVKETMTPTTLPFHVTKGEAQEAIVVRLLSLETMTPLTTPSFLQSDFADVPWSRILTNRP